MKKINIIYWIVTGLFGAFMLFSAIPDILMSPDAVTFITWLGYPGYFIPMIGVAKVLGVAAILIPGFPRLREWAYAGLFFDLAGAVYSVVAVAGFDWSVLVILLPVAFLFTSYFLHHRRLKAAAGA